MYLKLLLLGLLIAVSSSSSLASSEGELTEEWKLSQGGKIYDNWASTLNIKAPSDTHRAYPATGKKQGAATWRCKECHGWDYQGRDGGYSKGSHFTGIKGVSHMVGKPLTDIKKIVRNKIHGYSKAMISDKSLEYLAFFVSQGQVDMSKYIDLKSKSVKGDAPRGARFFQTICAVCHGLDGRQINFHPGRKQPEYVGTVASHNPWEIFHKIRNGQPGAAMISLRALSIQDQVDIIAYTKTLAIK